MKIKVVDVEGQKLTFMSVLIRETVGRYLSALIMYVGYIIAGLDTRKQGLHDKIADTLVIYNHTQPVKKPMPMPPRPMQPGGQPILSMGQPAGESMQLSETIPTMTKELTTAPVQAAAEEQMVVAPQEETDGSEVL